MLSLLVFSGRALHELRYSYLLDERMVRTSGNSKTFACSMQFSEAYDPGLNNMFEGGLGRVGPSGGCGEL